MSQAKVDRYKEEKANRKKTMKREKVGNGIRKFLVGVVGLLLIGWIGYSAYDTYDAGKEKEEVEIDYSAFEDLQKELDNAAKETKAE